MDTKNEIERAIANHRTAAFYDNTLMETEKNAKEQLNSCKEHLDHVCRAVASAQLEVMKNAQNSSPEKNACLLIMEQWKNLTAWITKTDNLMQETSTKLNLMEKDVFNHYRNGKLRINNSHIDMVKKNTEHLMLDLSLLFPYDNTRGNVSFRRYSQAIQQAIGAIDSAHMKLVQQKSQLDALVISMQCKELP